MKQGIIYSISCPLHNDIFYVGQTFDLEKRIKYYFYTLTHRSTAAERYVKKLCNMNKKPVFTIHIKCGESDINQNEYKLIDQCVSKGLLLLNKTGNSKDNYNSACEFYLGIPIPQINSKVEIIDLTAS